MLLVLLLAMTAHVFSRRVADLNRRERSCKDGSFPSTVSRSLVLQRFKTEPLSFEPNRGQSPSGAVFLARNSRSNLLFFSDGVLINLVGSAQDSARVHPAGERIPDESARVKTVRITVEGANLKSSLSGEQRLQATTSYYTGPTKEIAVPNRPARKRSAITGGRKAVRGFAIERVPNFARIKEKDIYPGIDMVYRGEGEQLEYDFIVAPGADASGIRLRFQGVEKLEFDRSGDLILHTDSGDMRQLRPKVYEFSAGHQHEIGGGYVLMARDEVAFHVDAHASESGVIIDPGLNYGTYFGTAAAEVSHGVGVDATGNAYIAGTSAAISNFTGKPVDTGFVSAYGPNGNHLFTTFVGDGRCNTDFFGIAVDGAGNSYLTGYNEPVNSQTLTCSGAHHVLAEKLNSSGQVVYGMLFPGGGTDQGNAIAIDGQSNAYITGAENSAALFPTTPGAFMTSTSAAIGFVSKVDPTGTKLLYSTFLGGTVNGDAGMGIAVDSTGAAHVTGVAQSPNFPLKNAFQTSPNANLLPNAFYAELDSSGSGLLYSTYLSGQHGTGQGDSGNAIGLDPSGNAYITGTITSPDFPTTKGAFQTVCNLNGVCSNSQAIFFSDAFVAKFNPALSGTASLVYSTRLGGSNNDFGRAIAVDPSGAAYVAGYTSSFDLPTVIPNQFNNAGGNDAFTSELSPDGSALSFSSYFGGTGDDRAFGAALDTAGNTFVSGSTTSTNLPINGLGTSFQPTYGGGPSDGFLVKFGEASPSTLNSLGVNPARVTVGGVGVGMVTLTGPAGPLGAQITLSSSLANVASVPANVTVPFGASSVTFPVSAVGAGTTTISASYNGAFKSFNFAVDQLLLSGLTLNPPEVAGSSSSIATVTLNGNAPSGGEVLNLSSGTPTLASVPAQVTVPAGTSSATFTITSKPVGLQTGVAIFAFDPLSGSGKNASLTLDPVLSLSLSSTRVLGGTSVTATVSLTAPAPTGGAVVTLSSNVPTVAAVPILGRVTIPAGALSATFTIATFAVGGDVPVIASARYSGAFTQALLTVSGVTLSSISLNTTTVVGGGGFSPMLTVTLSGPAPLGGTFVNLSSDIPQLTPPLGAGGMIPGGATSAQFTFLTGGVSSVVNATITASYNGVVRTASLVVTPATLQFVTVSPSVMGGSIATGLVQVTGLAAQGQQILVSMSSSNPTLASVTSPVVVGLSSTTATFGITTQPVSVSTTVTITASYAGVLRTATLTLTPSAALASLNPPNVVGGNASMGTITLMTAAPSTGAVVAVSSSNTSVATVLPPNVSIGAGLKTGTFTVNTAAVTSPTSVVISATYKGITSTTTLSILPPAALTGLTLSTGNTAYGNTVTGLLLFSNAVAGNGATVTLSSSNSAVAAPQQSTIIVPAGSTIGTFAIDTKPVGASTAITISATYAGVTKSASLTVRVPSIVSLTLNPNAVTGGQAISFTIRSDGNPGAATVSSSSNLVAVIPNIGWAGSNEATFPIQGTSPVSTSTPVTITVTGNNPPTGSASAILILTPPPPATVGSVSVNPTSVVGGTKATGTVTITGAAPAGGLPLVLSSSNSGVAAVPNAVTVPAGSTSTIFPIATQAVSSAASITISATFSSTTKSAALTVLPPTLSSLMLTPNNTAGGDPVVGAVKLTGPAPSGGALVTLTSSNTAVATVQATATIPAGQTTATFPVASQPVGTTTAVTITAKYGNVIGAAFLTLNPAALASLTLNPSTTADGDTSTGTVILTGPAPSTGAMVSLFSANPGIATLQQSSVTIPPGQTQGTFGISTSPFVGSASVTIQASYGGSTRLAQLTLVPLTITSLTLSPATMAGGNVSQGTLVFNFPAPSSGVIVTLVTLSSSNKSVATVPASITVPGGASTATFPITTQPVAANTAVTISATTPLNNQTKSATLTLTPTVLSSVTMSPNPVVSGHSSNGTVNLNGQALNTATATLTSSNPTLVQVQSPVTINAGAFGAGFTANAGAVAVTTPVTITATYGGASVATVLTVASPVLASLTLNGTLVTGGSGLTGTATLNGPVPASAAATVTLASSNTAVATVPLSVPIKGISTGINITTKPVATATKVTISATYNGVTRGATFIVLPPVVTGIGVSPPNNGRIAGGNTVQPSVFLNAPAPTGGSIVNLSTSQTAAPLPATVTVPAGQTSISFNVNTAYVSSNTPVTWSATLNGVTKSTSFTLTPVALGAIELNSTSAQGGNPITGQVFIDAPAPSTGTVVALASSNTAVATVPATVTVTAGQNSAPFQITTKTVSTTTAVNISVTLGNTLQLQITVSPP